MQRGLGTLRCVLYNNMILQNPRKAKKISSCETVRKVTTPAPGICTVEKVVIFSTVKFLCEKNRAPFLDGNAKQLCCKLQQNFLDNRLPNGGTAAVRTPVPLGGEAVLCAAHIYCSS